MRPARQSPRIGAREAETILGISRSALHRLATSGALAGRVVDRRGSVRHWTFKRSDVRALKAKGNYLKRAPKRRKQKQLWEQYFGSVPRGYTPAFRDGDRTNVAPTNLCLLALKAPRRHPAVRRRIHTIGWTQDQIAFLRREYEAKPRRELAAALGVSLSSLTRKARRLGLRKSAEYLREQARVAHRLPIGTERIHDDCDTVWVKVAQDGGHYQRWRPKQEILWEAATGKRLPRGWCVIFRDGNKRNFDPSNLEPISRRERAAQGFAQFLAYPEPLQAVIKLNAKLGREIQKRRERSSDCPASTTTSRRHVAHHRRWTAEMDDVLTRDYPTRPIHEITAALGVSLSSLRQRARRLHIRRTPETIIAEARAAGGTM